MQELTIGYLFKKKYVKYKFKEYEVFELVDYATAIRYYNKKYGHLYNIISGSYAGSYATESDAPNVQQDEFVFWNDNLQKAIQENNSTVDFTGMRKNKISHRAKYYVESKDGSSLDELGNKAIIDLLEKENKKTIYDFDEEVFEKSTDIFTMYNSIKKTIISQDEQIMQILTALFKNQKVINSNLDKDLIAKLKENILIYGSTGTGKTEILKRISKLYNIPIVIEDATSLSETGYQGRKITDMLEDLYLAANENMELAEKGILVIDEFDKLAERKGDTESHVSRLGVQRSLLKLLDGSLFYFDNKQFDSSKLTIVGLGAFTGITEGDNYTKLTNEDFMKYGIMRELMGRFSKTIAMNPLSKEDIIKILKNSDFSPLNTYKELFKLLEVEFEFNDEFIEYIADLAMVKQSGARSLKTVFDDCISSALFRIFAGEYSGISLIKPDNQNERPYVLTKKKK